ncbi:MAG: family 20 glycosylhydrolase [Acidobacteriaceae bacterium]|nr:family 20 glycosylhydrolase [Acidobacteriaceae bacterium]
MLTRLLTFFAVGSSVVLCQVQPALMPWPASVSVQPGAVAIGSGFSVSVSGGGATDGRVTAAVERIFERLTRQTGIPLLPRVAAAGQSATLTIVVESKDHGAPQRLGDDERYSLECSNGRVRISADRPLGVLRGIETFLQLVQENTSSTEVGSKGAGSAGAGSTDAGSAGASGATAAGFSVPDVTIRDEPRFEWRGLSLDVSRHFIPVEGVRRTLDGMAAVKLNVLHWHLSDDQGFRIESKKYPRLAQEGSDGMYYTQAEVRGMIAYARERGIRIVPEFDMPGHAASWLPGYPQLGTHAPPYQIVRGAGIFGSLIDPTKESTYKFLDGFVGEMAKLFPDEYFHIGGDEVDPKEWNQNTRIRAFMAAHRLADGAALQTYFNQRLLKIVTRHHKHMEGWDEVLTPGLPKSVVIQSWRGQESLWQAAREGYQGLLSAGYYLDLMQPASKHYAVDPMKLPQETIERLQKKNAPIPGALTPEQQKLILGGEAAMWEELATAENLDAKLWPRLAAIAERFWSPESVTDPVSMYQRMAVTNRWLEWLGLTQRSSLELMRMRLAGDLPVGPLDEFASVMEPVKGYARHAERYDIFVPFNRLVDAIPPESNGAREFREEVDRYLALPQGQRDGAALRKRLTEWGQNIDRVRPMLQTETLLSENLAAADALAVLCRAGEEALGYLDAGGSGGAAASGGAPGDWKARTQTAVAEAAKRKGDLLIQIAPGVEKLVDAVAGPGVQAPKETGEDDQ